MSITGWILTLCCAATTTLANLLLRVGVKSSLLAQIEGLSFAAKALNVFRQPSFLAGIVFYVLASAIWVKIIAVEPLSIAYPVLVSITFMLVTLGAMLFFHEPVTALKLSGMLLIVSGIYILSVA